MDTIQTVARDNPPEGVEPRRCSYWALVCETYAVNRCMTRTLSTVYEYPFLWASMLTTPFFLRLGMSANSVTLLMLLTGLAAAVIIAQGSATAVAAGTLMYLFAQVFDASDGNVARMTNTSSYFGRFIDGVVDIAILLALQLAYVAVLLAHHGHPVLIWAGIFAAAITPFHHFYYDRYSAFVRWINEEHGLHLQPYIRRSLSFRLAWALNDLQYTCLVALPLLMVFDSQYWKQVLLVYYLINILTGLYAIVGHTVAASGHMRVGAKNK